MRVIITGASDGLGRAIALELAGSGTSLVLAARRLSLLEQVASECRAKGSLATAVEYDASKSPEPVVRALSEYEGPIALVNNAGKAEFGSFHRTPFEVAASHLRVNLEGPMALTHAILPLMIHEQHGVVINIASLAAHHPFSGAAAYAASKAGIAMFGRVISEEYREFGVKVTNLYPGAMDTPIWGSGGPNRADMMSSDDVAKVVSQVIHAPETVTFDEVYLTPKKGIL
jgi:short-subunit dehydrogenase